MRKKYFFRFLILSVLILVPSLLSQAPYREAKLSLLSQSPYREAKLFAITRWDAGCGGSARSAWDDMGLAWYNEITRKGFYLWGHWWFGHGPNAYLKDGKYINGNIADSWFTDSDLVWWGNDKTFADEADACMICLHGSENSGRWQGSVRIDEAGSGNCRTWQGDMAFGDSDLEFLHLSSCHSLDDNQWFFEWASSFDGLHQVDGFHGWMWIGSSLIDDYDDFAEDAFSISIADAWLDNMYHADISGSDDQCPVAYAVGANSNDMWNRIGTERYNRVHSDPTTVRYVGCFYIANCDPANEDVCGDDAWSKRQVEKLKLSSDYRYLVEKALPKWDKRILDVPIRKINWVEKTSIPQIARAVKDEIKYKQEKWEMFEKAQDEKRIVKLDRTRGYIRFANQDRQFLFEKSSRQPVDPKKATQIAKETIKNLGLPIDELGQIRVDEVMAIGATHGAKEASDNFAKEQLVTIQRVLNDVPIFDSMARLAISNSGRVARILVRWPHFDLKKDLELKDHEHIIQEIIAEIVRLEEGKPISLTAKLAYISSEDDEQTKYYPGLIVTVKDEESGVIFTTNLAK